MREPLPPITSDKVTGELLRNLVGIDARVVLEIGANDGSSTHMLLNAFPQAKIYAFEPDPRAVAKFKARGPHPRVRLFEMAIGARDGTADFHVSSGLPPDGVAYYSQGWDQSGSLRRPNTTKFFWPWLKFENIIRVPVKRLDTWASEHGVGKVDFVWADTQGAEADLIVGGEQTLAVTRYLYTEYSNHEWYKGQPKLQQLLDMLPSFAIHTRYAMDVLLQNTAQRK
jgi:FkbM family methyltransferase